MVEGGNSVPKFCGSWPVRNWRILAEADRFSLHNEYKSFSHGKVIHGVDQCYALLTDTGVILWFV
jgi:hypothetical protein